METEGENSLTVHGSKMLEETLRDTSMDLCSAIIISENWGIKWDFDYLEAQNYFQVLK